MDCTFSLRVSNKYWSFLIESESQKLNYVPTNIYCGVKKSNAYKSDLVAENRNMYIIKHIMSDTQASCTGKCKYYCNA